MTVKVPRTGVLSVPNTNMLRTGNTTVKKIAAPYRMPWIIMRIDIRLFDSDDDVYFGNENFAAFLSMVATDRYTRNMVTLM